MTEQASPFMPPTEPGTRFEARVARSAGFGPKGELAEFTTYLGPDGPVYHRDGIASARPLRTAEEILRDFSGHRILEAPVADLAARVRDAIDAHHIAASFFTGPDLEALVCVCTDEHGSGEFATYEDFLAHQAVAVTAALRPAADPTKEASRG